MKKETAQLPGKLRLIGGKWRGRRISIARRSTLRPTPERLRETLFNWLAPIIEDSHCLDLFAGSGILGLEALSRGAQNAIWVERDRATAQQLRRQLTEFCSPDSLYCRAAEDWLLDPPAAAIPFDIVFLDPPFDDPAREKYCILLESSGLLEEHAWIYLESADKSQFPTPQGWKAQRQSRCGDVRGTLYRRNPTTSC